MYSIYVYMNTKKIFPPYLGKELKPPLVRVQLKMWEVSTLSVVQFNGLVENLYDRCLSANLP